MRQHRRFFGLSQQLPAKPWQTAKNSRSTFIQSIHHIANEKEFKLEALLLDSNNIEQLKEFNKDPLLKMVSASIIAQHIYEKRDALADQASGNLENFIELVKNCFRKYHFELINLIEIPEARNILNSSKRLKLVILLALAQQAGHEHRRTHEHKKDHYQQQ